MIIEASNTADISSDNRHLSTSLPSVPNELFLTSLSTYTSKKELTNEITDETRSSALPFTLSLITSQSEHHHQIESAAKLSPILSSSLPQAPLAPHSSHTFGQSLPVNDLPTQQSLQTIIVTTDTEALALLSTCKNQSRNNKITTEASSPALHQIDDLSTEEPSKLLSLTKSTSVPEAVTAQLCSSKSQVLGKLF